jgi:hypothetical protein
MSQWSRRPAEAFRQLQARRPNQPPAQPAARRPSGWLWLALAGTGWIWLDLT